MFGLTQVYTCTCFALTPILWICPVMSYRVCVLDNTTAPITKNLVTFNTYARPASPGKCAQCITKYSPLRRGRMVNCALISGIYELRTKVRAPCVPGQQSSEEEVVPAVTEGMDETSDALFTFGLIADIQYADIDDAYNYIKTRMRYYRNSLSLLQDATQKWASETVHPTFILQLGDIIDGFNVQYKSSETSLEKVLTEIEKLKVPVHHIWGNHEFYNFTREKLLESQLNSMPLRDSLTTSPEDADLQESFYAYHFSPFPKFRVLLIDCYDFSVIGRDKSSRQHVESLKLLKQKNCNEDLNSPEGLAETRFVLFNGGISKEQLHWIDKVLETSDNNEEKVMVAGHLPIHPDSTDPICLTWNYQEILSVLQDHPCVVTYFAGHDHNGGYCQDSSGIHHITFNGIIETPPGNQAIGTMHVYRDRMVLRGVGLVPNISLPYRKSS